MSFWNALFSLLTAGNTDELDDDITSPHQDAACIINPATGLPMLGGCTSLDVSGNPYGVDLSSHHDCSLTDIESGSDWPDTSVSSDPFSPWGD